MITWELRYEHLCFSNIVTIGLNIFSHFYTHILIHFSQVCYDHRILIYLKLSSLILRTPQNLTWFAINRIYIPNKRFRAYYHISCVHVSVFEWILFKINLMEKEMRSKNSKKIKSKNKCRTYNGKDSDIFWEWHRGGKKRWTKNRRLVSVIESDTTQMVDELLLHDNIVLIITPANV